MDRFGRIMSYSSANGLGVMNSPFPIYMNAGGAGCKAKCDVLYGDLAKAKCHTQYIKQPCGCTKSSCDCKFGSKCCQHNKQVPINIANCKKNVDARRASCKADCDAKAGGGVGDEPMPADEPIKDEAPEKEPVDSGNGGGAGAGAKKVDAKKILLYSGIAVAGIAGISLLIWGTWSAIKK